MRTWRRWRRSTTARWSRNALLAAGTVTTAYLAPLVAAPLPGVLAWIAEILLWGGATALLTAILMERRDRLPLWGSVVLTAVLLPLLLGGIASCAGRCMLALGVSLAVAVGFLAMRRAALGFAWRRGTLLGLLSVGFLGKVGIEALAGEAAPTVLAALGALAPQHVAGAVVGGILVVAATTSPRNGEPCPGS